MFWPLKQLLVVSTDTRFADAIRTLLQNGFACFGYGAMKEGSRRLLISFKSSFAMLINSLQSITIECIHVDTQNAKI